MKQNIMYNNRLIQILCILLVVNIGVVTYLNYMIADLRTDIKSVKYTLNGVTSVIGDSWNLAAGGLVAKTKLVSKHGANIVNKLKKISKWKSNNKEKSV